MVLEALVAISLTGNIVQFVHFGCSLFAKCQEVYRSTSGTTSELEELQVIAKHVEELLLKIDAPLKSQQSGTGKVTSSPTLVELGNRCRSVAFDLISALDDLNERGSKTSRKWRSFRMTLASIWKEDHIVRLEERLERLRDQVMFHLQDLVLQILDTWKKESAIRELETVNILGKLAQQLQTLEGAIPVAPNETLLEDLRLKFTSLSSLINRESKKLAILKSLRFDSMRVRESTIAEAHKRTYEWIFTPETLPGSDPRSRIKFLDWLKHGNGLYWVTGKPGSGKSTLMRFIEDHSSTCRALDEWTGSTTLRKASFYFWNAGTEMQKSLPGLFQSLLYNVLKSCPDLIPTICEDRWACHEHLTVASDPWTLQELRECFAKLKGGEATSNFFFLIDGLDEYNGHHEEIVEILQDLGSSPNIKLCVSSRPWNRFESAFGSSDALKLYLHTLTAEDIELFTKEQLLSQINPLDLQEELVTYQSIANEIVERAKGVFLWVCLVVRSLREGMLNGDTITILQERLAALPTDLEPFFEHIINSVEVFYKRQMATSFLIGLEALEPLRVMDYSFIEDEKSTIGLSLEWTPMSKTEIQSATKKTLKYLNRYKGLLEASAQPGSQIDHLAIVDFLHRTLRDFLQLPKPQAMLRLLVSEGFDVRQTM
ncbi:uncharacterized protein BDR25DRAFT_272291, partial [Lindgomyces ingoldianus]